VEPHHTDTGRKSPQIVFGRLGASASIQNVACLDLTGRRTHFELLLMGQGEVISTIGRTGEMTHRRPTVVPLMKTHCAMLILALWAVDFSARAQDKPPAIQLAYPGRGEIFSPDRRSANHALASMPIAAYGGGPLTFDLAVQAPLGTRLRIYADLIQMTSGSLVAPLQRNVAVSPELSFDHCTFMVVPCMLPELAAVRSKTRMVLSLRTEPKNPDLASGLLLPVFAYPREEPDAWKKMVAAGLARSGLHRLAVFGGSQGLREFLRERNVPFDDLGADWPTEPDTHTLYLAEIDPKQDASTSMSAPKQFGELSGVRLMLFAPSVFDPLPPSVYQIADPAGGSIWKVTLPGLFKNPGSQPQNLELLSEIFQQALAELPRLRSNPKSLEEPTP
jgi:hypothetical protein